MKSLYEEHSSKTFVTFINKSYGDMKRRCAIESQTKAKVSVQLHWITLFSKSSWIKTTTSRLSYELGVNGEKMSMETGMLLIKMEIARFTLLNL